MPLILRVLTYRNQPAPHVLAGHFGEAGGTLGRAPDNLLVLDDPSKYISRTHAQVVFRAGAYFLEDLGSNPSVVNDRPLGKGREIGLADGDRIVIGAYQLEARITAIAQAASWLPPASLNDAALPLFEPPPVSAPVALQGLEPLESLEPARFAAVGAASPAYPSGALDALAGARILDVGPGAGVDSAAGAAGAAGAFDDPLGLNLFGAAPLSLSAARVASVPGDLGLNLAPSYRAAESDHVSPELVSFRLPTADASPHTASPVASAFFKPSAPAASVRPASSFAIPDDYDPLADFLPIVETVSEVPFPLPASLESAASTPDAVPVVAPVTAQVADPTPSIAYPTSSVAAASDSAVLQALLRGLGLPDLHLNRSGVEVAETVGAMLREATAGTMDVLMARALTKKESRIDMTMISANANNPLKFFPNPDSALTQMLTNTMAGYMTPVQAMHSAFDDLRAHELAVIAGMRAALAAVLHRFDPAHIESRLAVPSVMDKMMSAHRKAKMWDRLVELYGEIAREADDDLQRLFGEKFSEAYAEQVERLRRAGK